ncbi:hypothetical protein MX629_13820 [Carnobacterium divergens]|uniref:Uncharacterized protein n=1 Tax=Carnobacterium divergens TaxID=2748 RepID=A0AAW8RCS3_CARDV|nr:hypothetical protein [Carnobacterium divergens]MDT1959498.1 hypothetical protein [Carnobacterium divergens]MDT1975465.1 hypothetical protein [Carnobacterium divergens]
MTKIDETKQYKFSEIVRMVEDKELPVGTKVAASEITDYLLVAEGLNTNKLTSSDGDNIARFNFNIVFSRLWTIKLPKEDKYYLKAPDCFDRCYLNLELSSGVYFFDDSLNTGTSQTQFTQLEIDDMPFDINFFKKIKVED